MYKKTDFVHDKEFICLCSHKQCLMRSKGYTAASFHLLADETRLHYITNVIDSEILSERKLGLHFAKQPMKRVLIEQRCKFDTLVLLNT